MANVLTAEAWERLPMGKPYATPARAQENIKQYNNNEYMAEISNPILQKLDGLEARYEEVSTLITDPAVIADQNRYVKLTKEWKDLGDIMNARKRYINCLEGIREAKDILANETDPEMKDMAREELAANEELEAQTGRGNQNPAHPERS